jgi:hypothetical protein
VSAWQSEIDNLPPSGAMKALRGLSKLFNDSQPAQNIKVFY